MLAVFNTRQTAPAGAPQSKWGNRHSSRKLVRDRHFVFRRAFGLTLGIALPFTVSTECSGELNLVPQPVHAVHLQGEFVMSADTALESAEAFAREGDLFRKQLQQRTGFALSVPRAGASKGAALRLIENTTKLDGAEAYSIEVSPTQAVLRASTPAGIFRASQTFLQLLPIPPTAEWRVPCVRIEDAPRFAWRGLMLDCSRTFQSMEYLKLTLDRMAFYKLNVLHLHLTDDQGWRLEIRRYPELTQAGARFAEKYHEPKSRQGHYTQSQIRQLLAWAAERHIMVVPEIEMPGHCIAALACFPELSCRGGPFEIFPYFQGPKITEDVFCAGNERTFEFLDHVLAEVAELFPAPYIHIGGDEVPKAAWNSCSNCQARIRHEGLKDESELQSYFIRRVSRTVEKHGKRLIGWDEILEGGLAPGAIVMSWRGTRGGIAAATAGHDVIMSPNTHCYFDYPYGRIDSAQAFAFDPLEGIPSHAASRVLGLQANFWSHIDREPARVDRQLFPRLLALAERGWSPDNRIAWPDYLRRARVHLAHLEQLGIHYEIFDLAAPVGEWTPQSFTDEEINLEFDVTWHLTGPGEYHVKPVYNRGTHGLFIRSAELVGVAGAVVRQEGFAGKHPKNDVYVLPVRSMPEGESGQYRLRLSVQAAGGTNSWGKVFFLRAKAPASPEL